jgi:hypothetical protein
VLPAGPEQPVTAKIATIALTMTVGDFLIISSWVDGSTRDDG